MSCARRAPIRSDPWDPLDAQGRPLVPVPTPGVEAPGPRLGLRAQQIRAGAPDADARAGLRHGRRGAAAVERLRPRPGALEPLHRRARDLRLAAAQRPAADDLRGRPAAPRLRPCRATSPDAFLLALEHPKAPGEVFNIGSGEDRSVERGRARCSPSAMGRADLEPEITGKARAGDIRHCIADIAKARERARLRAEARFRARGSPSSPNGSRGRRPRTASTRPARSSSCEGWWHDGASAPARPALVGRRPVLVTGGAGFIGSQPRRPPRRARATTSSSSTRWRGPASSATSPGCKAPPSAADLARHRRHPRRARRSRGRGAGRRGGLPPRGAGRGDDEPRRRRARISTSTSRGTLNLLEALRRRSEPVPLVFARPTRSTATSPTSPLDETDDAYRAARSGGARARHRRGPAARFPHALWLLEGRRRPVRARLRPQLRHADRGLRMSCIYGPRQMGTEDQGWVAHFLIRALDGEPITHLRRRPAGARRPRRRATPSRPISRPGGASTPCRAAPSTSAAGPANAVSLRQLLAPYRGH